MRFLREALRALVVIACFMAFGLIWAACERQVEPEPAGEEVVESWLNGPSGPECLRCYLDDGGCAVIDCAELDAPPGELPQPKAEVPL